MSEAAKIWLALGFAGLLIGGLIFLIVRDPGLSLCDEAIKAQLKAPSTYERISASGPRGSYRIEYDAANSFGVPLRGQGYCTVKDGHATWLDLTDALRPRY